MRSEPDSIRHFNSLKQVQFPFLERLELSREVEPATLIAILLLSGCRLSGESPTSFDSKADAVWHKHELALQEALQGHQKDDEFEHSCEFFERITGLKMHVNFFTLGVLPTTETEKDLAHLRAWYRINKHRLFWDESTQTVKVRPR